MCPTRELAVQVTGQINLLGKYKNIRAHAIYGGSEYGNQIHALKSGAQIVVGTPGRLIDHLERGTMKLDAVKTVILDEADEMISMGFKEDLEAILKGASGDERNIWLFSATMSREVRRVADTYLLDPEIVQVNRTEMLSTTVEQIFYRMKESDKPEILCRILESIDDFYGLVFCQTKSMVTDLTQYLNEKGIKVDCLHGDKDQKAREKTMQLFRDRKVRLLICTDVASRGLDVKDITHVINYSLPRESELYVHRIGRTARGGKSGIALSLVTPSHMHLVGKLERLTKTRITEAKLPSRKDVAALRVSKLLPQFQKQEYYSRVIELMGPEWKEAIATMSPEEIVGRFINLIAPEFFDGRAAAKPLQVATEAVQRPPREDSRRSERRFGGRSGGPDRRDYRGGPDRRDRGDRSARRDRPEQRSERSGSGAGGGGGSVKRQRRSSFRKGSSSPAPDFLKDDFFA